MLAALWKPAGDPLPKTPSNGLIGGCASPWTFSIDYWADSLVTSEGGIALANTEPRFKAVTEQKANGETYTPAILADFVASQIIQAIDLPPSKPIRILDPATGDGELLIHLLARLPHVGAHDVEVHGFETDQQALQVAMERLQKRLPQVSLRIEQRSFLSFVLDQADPITDLLASSGVRPYDIIIANPPYVRTQVMGAAQAQQLADLFGLSGRVDLYHAFVIGMSRLLSPSGVAGIIVSNRFMTTESGYTLRKALMERLDLIHTWDLGDTRLFDAAVLPAVLLARGGAPRGQPIKFTSIYQTKEPATAKAGNAVDALGSGKVVALEDGRRFRVRHGQLCAEGRSGGVWRVANKDIDRWLGRVERRLWKTFGEVGRVRVGIKTCADSVFIRDDWHSMSDGVPELLRPITTHHVRGRYRPAKAEQPRQVLYPHEVVEGKRRAVELQRYPISRKYLERHREALERRRYVLEGGRAWYELWVPQHPGAWKAPKLVFRDIAEKPSFWIDREGTVVNGDCYWFAPDPVTNRAQDRNDLLALAAAVGNSTFSERFYDYRFNNRLYAGRRRYATQYVRKFPLPDPRSMAGKAIIAKVKELELADSSRTVYSLEEELDAMVWEGFGLTPSRE